MVGLSLGCAALARCVEGAGQLKPKTNSTHHCGSLLRAPTQTNSSQRKLGSRTISALQLKSMLKAHPKHHFSSQIKPFLINSSAEACLKSHECLSKGFNYNNSKVFVLRGTSLYLYSSTSVHYQHFHLLSQLFLFARASQAIHQLFKSYQAN